MPLGETPVAGQRMDEGGDNRSRVSTGRVQLVFSIEYEGLSKRQQVRRRVPARTISECRCFKKDLSPCTRFSLMLGALFFHVGAATSSSRLGRSCRGRVDWTEAAQNH